MTDSVITETIHYTAAGIAMKSYLARPDDGAKHPAVMVLPEWWGLDDYPKRRAEQLAEAGYIALATDLYGEGKIASAPDEAAGLMQALLADSEQLLARVSAAADYLRSYPLTVSAPISAMGYCLGGAVALTMARNGMDLAAAISFHGNLAAESPAQPGEVKARLLVCHGNDDAMVDDTQVSNFKAEMDAAGAHYEFIGYDGAQHGFTNPAADERRERYGVPLGYNKSADTDSWSRLLSLLSEVYS